MTPLDDDPSDRPVLEVNDEMPTERRHRSGLHGRIGTVEMGVLLLFLLLVAGIWGFLALSGEVMAGGTRTMDERILLALRNPDDLSDPLGPLWFEEMVRDFTALGGIGVLTLLTVGVAGYFLMCGQWGNALWLAAVVLGGFLLNLMLKQNYARLRPDLVPHITHETSSSFPSGHAMMAAIAYLTLGILFARLQKRRGIALYILTCAITITFLVGCSRVYLGVHWPSDVVAGWTAGAAWALLGLLTTRWLARKTKT